MRISCGARRRPTTSSQNPCHASGRQRRIDLDHEALPRRLVAEAQGAERPARSQRVIHEYIEHRSLATSGVDSGTRCIDATRLRRPTASLSFL